LTNNLPFDNSINFWQGRDTSNASGTSAPDRSGFFVPPVREMFRQSGGSTRAEYKTRKGNKLRRLASVVETHHLINVVKQLKRKEAHMSKQTNAVVPVSVSFHNTTLITAKVEETEYTAMKPIVNGMGLIWARQSQKIRDSRYRHMYIPMQTSGGIQKMLCLPVKKLNGWLFSINPEKVKPEIKEAVIQYQEECFAVLYDYWHKGIAVNERFLTPDQQRKIQQLIGEKVYATGNKKLYPTLFKQIYRSIKDEFHVGKYNQVPVDRFSELVAYVGKVNVGGQEEFNEADQIHMKDIADVADGISNELKTVTKTLFLVQAYVGRVLQDVCVLMPREFAEMKRRKRIAEN